MSLAAFLSLTALPLANTAQAQDRATYLACLQNQFGIDNFSDLSLAERRTVLANPEKYSVENCNQAPAKPGDPDTTVDTFQACVFAQLGARFKDLDKSIQAEIIKEYDRFSSKGCKTPSQETFAIAPPLQYEAYTTYFIWGALAIFLMSVLNIIIRQRAFSVKVPSRKNSGRGYDWKPRQFKTPKLRFTGPLYHLMKDPQNDKPSLGRIIALVGLYYILLTFLFTSRYSFWALSERGDNTVFNQSIQNLLIPGLVAFLPYIAAKVSEAVKKSDATPTPEVAQDNQTPAADPPGGKA